MRIVTSSWFTRLPAGYLRVGVSRSVPRTVGPGYRRLRMLEPGDWLHAPPAVFILKYQDLLGRLDAGEIVGRIAKMSAGYEAAALLCYERSGWCHRSMAAQWFERELGISVPEYGHEGCGCHPLAYRG